MYLKNESAYWGGECVVLQFEFKRPVCFVYFDIMEVCCASLCFV